MPHMCNQQETRFDDGFSALELTFTWQRTQPRSIDDVQLRLAIGGIGQKREIAIPLAGAYVVGMVTAIETHNTR